MNRLYLLLFLSIIGVSTKAQNWQTVYSDRVQYFDSGVNAIKIISKQIDNNGDSILYNYPALYLDALNYEVSDRAYDSVSWLGKKMLIKPTGENCFINGLNDTLIIQTNAKDKESWEFLRNSNTLITAKVDSVSYGDYNGIKDSVKHISLSVVANSSKYQNMIKGLHKKQIWLSKHNGFLRVPILEYILNVGWNHYFFSAKSSYNQTKINLFTNKNIYDYDVGDIIHSRSNFDESSERWILKEYVNKSYDSIGDSVKYTIRIRSIILNHETNPDTTIVKEDSTFTVNETYYGLSQQALGIMPMSLSPFITTMHVGDGKTEFIISENNKCKLLEINQTKNYFEQRITMGYTSKKGFNYLYEDYSRGGGKIWVRSISIPHARNSCGQFGKDVISSISKKSKDVQVSLYPNPANDIIIIKARDVRSIELIDLQGKTIISQRCSNEEAELLNVSQLKEGIYIIKIVGTNNTSIQKVIIQH